MSTTSTKSFRFAGIQLHVTSDKEVNLRHAVEKVKEASKNGARVVCLPEIFNSPYQSSLFPQYAEDVSDPSSPSPKALSDVAKEEKIYLIGGSIPEREAINGEDKIYNTCLIYGPDGKLLAKHRKVHLFDIDVPGKITFRESDTLTGGNDVTVFPTEWCDIGVGICYDIRFPELAQVATSKGSKMLVYPGAFNMTTGPAHWELLLRSRAVDNQLFVAGVAPARNLESSYHSWGHTSVIEPWGSVLSTTEEGPSIVYADIDLDRVDDFRSSIPTLRQKRRDLYELVEK
ncbi:hypothetical protein PROFUN_14276 [Planoprotostelium fungivorum]|uniref:CN hydrolase domain-containing protein n=1 Tax=Planoprotostelium fungivorum TaxID=1890364 RepID=A0A2P6N0F2_9EUKA|nr:hypothetical protein PROFUN_14276 [Planoprotostelium fungivorum]